MVWTLDDMTQEILGNEGALSNDPSDSGHLTKYGITIGFAKTHPEFFDMNGDGLIQDSDILRLTPDVAKKAYVQFFYVPAKLASIPNISNITMQLFDLAVNVGVRYGDGETEAVKVFQHALGCAVIDGELGPVTQAAFRAGLAKYGEEEVNNRVVDARIIFYGEVVAAHPQDRKFLTGWVRRANKYRVALPG